LATHNYWNNKTEVKFGSGARELLIRKVSKQKVALFCSQSAAERLKKDPVLADLFALENVIIVSDFSDNPKLSEMEAISERYFQDDVSLIVAIGGGSAMDAAKVASMTLKGKQKNLILSEILENPKLAETIPTIEMIALPTTAGTGSEVTPFATVWDHAEKKKKSLSASGLQPDLAIIDPDFLTGLPLEVALSTGLDAMNQALESLWNINSNNISQALALRALSSGLEYLPEIRDIKSSETVRLGLMNMSLMAGMAISHTRTGLCHSISYPLTMRFGLPHGFACAFSMVEVLELNGDSISKVLSFGSITKEQIRDTITAIFQEYEYEKKILKYGLGKTAILEELGNMYSPDRANNNITPVNHQIIVDIVEKSCQRFGII